MDLKEYQKHAKRTMNWDLGPNAQLSNMALGIAGELGEITEEVLYFMEPQEKIKDEGGDVCWYIANLCTVLSLDWTQFMSTKEPESYPDDLSFGGDIMLEIHRHSGTIADVIKKTVAQGHVLNIDKLVDGLKGLLEGLSLLFNHYGLTYEEVCEYNHLKLMKRYKNGFTTEASVNREV